MDHVPQTLAAVLRQAGLVPAGPMPTRGGRPRWTALDGDGGRWAATEVPATAAARARARASALAAVEHPHLAVVGPVLTAPDGAAVVLVAAEPGVDLAVLLAARGPLTAGEVVGLIAPVAEGLARVHAAGLAHGGLGATDVVLTATGPVLAVAGEPATGDLAAAQADDVARLATLGLRLLGPVAVGAAVDACRRGGSAAELAAGLRAAARPTPVELPDPAVLAGLALRRLAGTAELDEPAPRRRRRARRRVRSRGVAGVAGVMVVGVMVTGVVLGGGAPWRGLDRAGSAQTRATVEAERVTRERVLALAAGSRERLAVLTEPGSPAAALDADLTLVRTELDAVVVTASAPTTEHCPADLVCVPVRTEVDPVDGPVQRSSVVLGLRPGTWQVVQVSAGG